MGVLSEQLAELRDEMDRLSQQLAAGTDAGPVIASDDSGAVTVTIVGARVDDVTVRPDWRDHVAATDLGDAVTAAVMAAGMAHLTRWATTTAAQAGEPGPRPRPLPRPRPAATEADEDVPWSRQLMAMVEAATQDVDQMSAQLAAATTATYTGWGAGGHAWVTVTGTGQVAEVGFDRRWLVDAHGISVSREATQAFRAAYDRMPGGAVADIVSRSALGEVTRG